MAAVASLSRHLLTNVIKSSHHGYVHKWGYSSSANSSVDQIRNVWMLSFISALSTNMSIRFTVKDLWHPARCTNGNAHLSIFRCAAVSMVSARHSSEVTNLKDILSDLIPAEQKRVAAFR